MKRLFYDIEVSGNIGLFWRCGYKLNITYDNVLVERAIICISYKWEGEKKVHNIRWDKGDDRKLLNKFIKVLDKADEIVAHNGDKFDITWIRTRCIFHDIYMRNDYILIDTLKLARSRAGKGFNFNSNRLDSIAKFLKVGAKIKTDYELWKAITVPAFLPSLRPLDASYYRALDKMCKYCNGDVKVLQRVYDRLKQYIPEKIHAGVLMGGEKWTCPKCGSGDIGHHGIHITKLGTETKRMRCHDCKITYTISTRLWLDWNQYILDLKKSNAKIR